MPDYLPAHRELVYASGVAEAAGGAGLLSSSPTVRKYAAWWLIATLIAVFPANLHMALHPERYPQIPGGKRDALRAPAAPAGSSRSGSSRPRAATADQRRLGSARSRLDRSRRCAIARIGQGCGHMATDALRGGIDLGGTKIQAIIANAEHQVLGQARRPTPTEGGPPDVDRRDGRGAARGRRGGGRGTRRR